MARQDLLQLSLQVGAREYSIDEVRPIEGADELEGILQPQLARDVSAHAPGGGRRVGVQADAGKPGAKVAELPVLGTKIVPPLADAVRFVHRDEADVAP